MLKLRIAAIWTVLFGAMVLDSSLAFGQKYPYKPIRIVITAPAGGSTDLPARLIAPGLAAALGQPVVIDNRGDSITVEIVGKAPPDGYTLMMTGAGFIMEPLFRKTAYDPVRDFSPVTLAMSPPYLLVVNPSLKATSVKELIALAKASPGALNYGSAGVGGAAHLAAELFKAMAGVNIVHVPYKGNVMAVNDIVAGQLQMIFVGPSIAQPYLVAGKVRALAITTAQPSELAPGLPTVAATLPGYETSGMVGLFAPAKTPAIIIKQLNEEIVKVLKQPEIKQSLLGMGVVVIANTPEEFAATIKSDMTKWGKLVKDLGLRAD